MPMRGYSERSPGVFDNVDKESIDQAPVDSLKGPA